MSRRVLVVGSGPSGVHFALTALRRGFEVTMVDVGRRGPPPVFPDATFDQLKERLDDPARYLLGADLEGLVLPTREKEYYGFPPGKQHVFASPPGFDYLAQGFEPLFAFARGGLAEVWTAGCYPFNDAELDAFPFGFGDLSPWYDEIADRIGVTGEVDDLAPFMPVHAHLLPPLALDPHSAGLLEVYQRKKSRIQRTCGAVMGRSRVATLSVDRPGRPKCGYLGRCLWGCPTDSLYTPSQTFRELERFEGFRYLPDLEALYFRLDPGGTIQSIVGRSLSTGEHLELPVERLALAAGTLASAKIVLRSVLVATGEAVTLPGLMDNRQALVPFLNLRRLGRPVPETSYQYHLLGMGLTSPNPAEYIHCQISTLKTALIHPIVQALPFDIRTALAITRATRAALGVVNVNFLDTRREENTLSLDLGSGPDRPRLRIAYRPPDDEPVRIRAALGRLRRALRQLGCVVPPGMAYIRPMGASVHYAGILPMSRAPGRWTTTPEGRSRDFPNLFLADGSTFPFLPAKNLTFTLMANAARLAAMMHD